MREDRVTPGPTRVSKGSPLGAGAWVSRAALAALTAVVVLLAGSGAAASASTIPPEGVFENCPLDRSMATCLSRLGVMHAGGVGVVVTRAGGTSLGALSAYASAAHAMGMSVMWELSDPDWWREPSTSTSADSSFGAFASGCGCHQNGPLLAFVIRWLGALPGTYGYYAADDSMLSPGDHAGMAAYVSQIKRQDPAHTLLIGSANESQAQQYRGIADVIGQEVYPVMTGSLMPVGANQGTWDGVVQFATDTQHASDRARKQSAFILQAFTWGDNIDDGAAIGACSPNDTKWACYAKLRYPSAREQLQLRNEILLHAHPKLILWWSFPGTYGDAAGDTYSIYPSGAQAASRWAGLSAAIKAAMPGATAPRRHRVRAHAARRHRARAHAARTHRAGTARRDRRHHRSRHRRRG